MKKCIRQIFLSITLISSILMLFQSCGNREETVSCFPNVSVNVVLNLNLPAYYNLQTIGGWIYVNEQNSGTKGLIIVKTSSGFKIYDRNAPHICPESNTTLQVVNDIKIVCPKDQAEWILLTGQPTSVAQIAPKTYPYSYDAATNVISIYN